MFLLPCDIISPLSLDIEPFFNNIFIVFHYQPFWLASSPSCLLVTFSVITAIFFNLFYFSEREWWLQSYCCLWSEVNDFWLFPLLFITWFWSILFYFVFFFYFQSENCGICDGLICLLFCIFICLEWLYIYCNGLHCIMNFFHRNLME